MNRPPKWVVVLVAALVVIASYLLGGLGEERPATDLAPAETAE